MDDTHPMRFDLTGGVDDGNPAYLSTRPNGEPLFETFAHAPNTSDWFDRRRCADTVHNDWGIDRASQRSGLHYTGIANITLQDHAVTDSMGPISDHAWEHPSPTDHMIARTRGACCGPREGCATRPPRHRPQTNPRFASAPAPPRSCTTRPCR